MTAEPLVCPACGTPARDAEPFCAACGMPVTRGGRTDDEQAVTPAQERARKVKRQYLDGPLVTVAGNRHQIEAELIQQLLLEEGVPSMLRRSGAFDVPDMLVAGPRDVLVPQSGAEIARDVLRQQNPGAASAAPVANAGHAVRLAAGLMLAIVVVAVVLSLGIALTS